MPCPGSLPNPIHNYIASLRPTVPPSTPHSPSFFDPPSESLSPLSPIVARAKSFIHELLPPWAENHVYRTYAFGLVAADFARWSHSKPDEEHGAEKLGWDKELWFLTAILHDIGWDAEGNLSKDSRLSFEIYGGVKAREFLLGWGANQEVADEVCESIIRHTVTISTSLYPFLLFMLHDQDSAPTTAGSVRLMCALTQVSPLSAIAPQDLPNYIHKLGALHDLVGVGIPTGWLHPTDNITICERWPRVGIAQHCPDFIDKELGQKPGCLSYKWGGETLRQKMKDVECFKGLEGISS